MDSQKYISLSYRMGFDKVTGQPLAPLGRKNKILNISS